MFEKIGIASVSVIAGLALGWVASDIVKKTHAIEKEQHAINEQIEELYEYLTDSVAEIKALHYL